LFGESVMILRLEAASMITAQVEEYPILKRFE